ncbi:MAG: hypothetical protein RLZ39_62, partial [Bacteroidota bacterium]
MPRYFIEVCYDGAYFGGFQIQNNQQTIQLSLEIYMNVLFCIHFSLSGFSFN